MDLAHQAPPSMEFSRQEYWSGLPFPSPGDLSNPGIEPGSPAFPADALTSEPPGQVLVFIAEFTFKEHFNFTKEQLPREGKVDKVFRYCLWQSKAATLWNIQGSQIFVPYLGVFWASLVAQVIKNPPAMQETQV